MPSTYRTKYAHSASSLVLVSEDGNLTEDISTSSSSVSLDSSLPFPYEKIKKRNSSRKIRTLSHHRSYNNQPSPIDEATEPDPQENSKSNVSTARNSLFNSSHPGGVLSWFRRRVSERGLKSKIKSQDSTTITEKSLEK
ncbi:555_t:CDS:1 [Acaulospora colombiana]|uniref:555_t:CDS:1 n=1 Tax=Acaulospora colombiana TaxID=27376 RepID=A0ACA9LKD7_9GLOM|nr:555_t:CDS:1 [Acaulospora colombiana]